MCPRISGSLPSDNLSRGYTGAKALNPSSATQTANSLLYSSLTTVARRPGKNYSWIGNWPSEPLVGNTPTKSPFVVDMDFIRHGFLRGVHCPAPLK